MQSIPVSGFANSNKFGRITLLYTIHRCPACWGRRTENPACFLMAGILIAGLKWVSGGRDFRVSETACIARGASACEFTIPKDPIHSINA